MTRFATFQHDPQLCAFDGSDVVNGSRVDVSISYDHGEDPEYVLRDCDARWAAVVSHAEAARRTGAREFARTWNRSWRGRWGWPMSTRRMANGMTLEAIHIVGIGSDGFYEYWFTDDAEVFGDHGLQVILEHDFSFHSASLHG